MVEKNSISSKNIKTSKKIKTSIYFSNMMVGDNLALRHCNARLRSRFNQE
jgi:hypothetical protein